MPKPRVRKIGLASPDGNITGLIETINVDEANQYIDNGYTLILVTSFVGVRELMGQDNIVECALYVFCTESDEQS